MENYGFVYLWHDKKHKRYYIGCRWGNENDGYICSSPWMKRGYKLRPHDFKRRVISRVFTNRKDLLEEEYKWLSKIKSAELGKKYYNLHNHHFSHWSTDENKRLTIGQKISNSPLRRQKISEANRGRPSKFKGIPRTEEWKQWFKNNHPRNNLGKKLSEETKLKMSLAHTGISKSFEHIKNSAKARTGLKRTEETKKRMSEAQKGKKKPWVKGRTTLRDPVKTKEKMKQAALLREEKKRNMKQFNKSTK